MTSLWPDDGLVCFYNEYAPREVLTHMLRALERLRLLGANLPRAIRDQLEDFMSMGSTFLAVFLGGKSSPRMAAWIALPEAERQAKTKEGIAAWKAWIEKHRDAVVEMGGPLGKTKKIAGSGIEDVSNDMGAFMVVRAASQEEAASLFEHHPHFTIFPGQSVEVMPVLPIPEG